MKNNLKYIAVALTAASLTACADLDTEYQGGYVNADQIEQAKDMDEAKQQAQVIGMFSFLKSIETVSTSHDDFGYPALMLGFDLQCADLYGMACGYNWFRSWEAYGSPTPSGTPTVMCWSIMYQDIKICNDFLLEASKIAEPDARTSWNMAQARALRAFDYWVLANAYQFNYATHQDAPCVPIIDETNMEAYVTEGGARKTVGEVYNFIMKDIDYAINVLSTSSISPSSMVPTKAKRLISAATAYGLRARFNMSMGKYAEAAADAQNAISAFSGRPYSIEEVSVPAFTDLDEPSWMWGIAVDEVDDCVRTGIVNFPGQISSFAYGYVMYGGWRFCDTNLYNSISRSDVRKGWFTDERFMSPNLNDEQQEYILGYSAPWDREPVNASAKAPAHVNVKYAPYKNIIRNSVNASDIPLMRVEEMYLILAEAEAMAGDLNAGKATLESFIKRYRDPQYVCEASDAMSFQDEVFRQKRIELWGEGLIYFEYQRLAKEINRSGGDNAIMYTYVLPAFAPQRIYCIPLSEITANKQISDDDNNTSSPQPTPTGE